MLKFIGIGAQKAGTTWLYQMLKQHPDINFPKDKEIHYWNNQYPNTPVNIYLNYFSDPKRTEGEITPAYAFLSLDRIKNIHDIAPDLRIIFILRNPIDRAWSAAKMALMRAEMEFNEASDQWFIDHFNSKGSLLRGDYEANLKNWHAIFEKEQILTLDFDDITNKPDILLERSCKHLNIRKYTTSELSTININKKVFSSKQANPNAVLYEYLVKLYQAKITSLGIYLDIDLSYWYQ